VARNNYQEIKAQLIDVLYDVANGASIIEGLTYKDLAELLGRELDAALNTAFVKVTKELTEEGTIIALKGANQSQGKDYILVDNIRDHAVPSGITSLYNQISQLRFALGRVRPTMVSMDMPTTMLIGKLVSENRFLWNIIRRVEGIVGKVEEAHVDGEETD
jgi:hypothetical protein